MFEAVVRMTHFWDDLWGQTFLGIELSVRAVDNFIGSKFLIPGVFKPRLREFLRSVVGITCP